MPDSCLQRQSPIDLSDPVAADALRLTFDYQGSADSLISDGSIAQIRFDHRSAIQIDDRPYRLIQTHWHTPAEHTIDGQSADAELHLVHTDPDGALAVIGICYTASDRPDNAVARLIDFASAAPHADPFPAAILQPSGGCYHYTGSLTTPPYSEPVLWFVADQIHPISKSQINALTQINSGPNARPIQPRNARPILHLPN